MADEQPFLDLAALERFWQAAGELLSKNAMADETPRVPEGDRYLWWRAGAEAEARERNEGMNPKAREVRDLVEALARRHPDMTEAELALRVARICCPEYLKRRHRI
jgi:hypothetical protein